MPLILGILQVLPQLVQGGFQVAALVNHVNANATPAGPVETFASQVLLQLPGLIAAGTDIYALVSESAARVKLMQSENRGPTDAEKADQTARLAALDAGYDKAAGA